MKKIRYRLTSESVLIFIEEQSWIFGKKSSQYPVLLDLIKKKNEDKILEMLNDKLLTIKNGDWYYGDLKIPNFLKKMMEPVTFHQKLALIKLYKNIEQCRDRNAVIDLIKNKSFKILNEDCSIIGLSVDSKYWVFDFGSIKITNYNWQAHGEILNLIEANHPTSFAFIDKFLGIHDLKQKNQLFSLLIGPNFRYELIRVLKYLILDVGLPRKDSISFCESLTSEQISELFYVLTSRYLNQADFILFGKSLKSGIFNFLSSYQNRVFFEEAWQSTLLGRFVRLAQTDNFHYQGNGNSSDLINYIDSNYRILIENEQKINQLLDIKD